ncbi:MAG: N-acetyl-alpha-D-glucosaminyl L-malate synthase BshA [Candidatus Berkelbacteria bacterium]|nr:N-acetyl-alpha-D-glucosaminyl L-malate synthase BshA [Candidatus Berkelbacteria bacterium]
MKIGLICNPWLGGAGAVPTELGKVLAKRGHKVHFFAFDIPFRLIGPWRQNIFFHKIESMEYPAFNNSPDTLTAASLITEVVLREKIEILNAHFAGVNSEIIFLAKEMLRENGYNIKTLNTLHGSDISILGLDTTIKEAMTFLLKKSDDVMTVSHALSEDAKIIYNLKKVDVIHNFVDTNEYKPKTDKTDDLRKIFAKPGEKIIFHSSNFRSIKRISDVIGIFRLVNKKIPCKLLLVGEGPDQQLASKLAAKYKIIDRIHFLGFQSDMAKLLPVGDVFLLPSEKENFSLSALEAMACGLPVISSDVGGMKEMIDHKINGYLAPVGDVEIMSNYAIDLLNDDAKLINFSKLARNKVVKFFGPEKIVPRYENLYKKIIKLKS